MDHPEVSNASFRLTCKSASSANGHRPPVCMVVAFGRWEREEELQHSPQPSEEAITSSKVKGPHACPACPLVDLGEGRSHVWVCHVR